STRMLTLPNRATWIATGNNVRFGGQLGRRVVRIRLDARCERPEDRQFARSETELRASIREERGEQVWARLVLVQNWIARGRPKWDGVPMGGFEGWSVTLGGILAAAGLVNFLQNRSAVRAESEPDQEQWKDFFSEW